MRFSRISGVISIGSPIISLQYFFAPSVRRRDAAPRRAAGATVWLISSGNPYVSFEDTEENPCCPRYEIWDVALFFDSALLSSRAGISVRGQRRPKRLGTWSRKTRRNQCLGQRPVHLLHTSIFLLPSPSSSRRRSFSVSPFLFQFSSFPLASHQSLSNLLTFLFLDVNIS